MSKPSYAPTVAVTVYAIEEGFETVYFGTKREAMDWKRERGLETPIEKLHLGEGWTPRQLVLAILNGEGFIASRETVG